MRFVFAALLVCVAAAPASAKCAPSAQEATSANGKYKVVPALSGTFTFFERDDAKKDFSKKHEGKLELPGHHVKTLVADDGSRFVLWDEYEGLAIHDAEGKLVKKLAAETLLDENERKDRPHRWACHPEGQWLGGEPSLEGRTLRLTLHSSRAVNLSLETGEVVKVDRWVVPGTCETPDAVKAHGAMNCIEVEWTCPRCQKKQTSLAWDICPACARELGVCIVCRKRAKR